jgi:hypothetical protein
MGGVMGGMMGGRIEEQFVGRGGLRWEGWCVVRWEHRRPVSRTVWRSGVLIARWLNQGDEPPR